MISFTHKLITLFLATLFSFTLVGFVTAQEISIHQEEQANWNALGSLSTAAYDSLNHYQGKVLKQGKVGSAPLLKRIFGYHPFWSGSAWQNYQWELLTDICYFSYEVDPLTGNPVSEHEWATDPVIDTALAHGVKVHLCVTLFSGHSAFFANPTAQQTLATNLIYRIQTRGAQGVNLDFEAVPSAQQAGLTACIQFMSQTLKQAIPDLELSIAAPAVNWSNTFNVPAISPFLDFIVIMAYDYYWNGSTLAGPVAGLWPLTTTFLYGSAGSLTYYQSQGVPAEKLILGQPYYGREWPVNGNILPALTTGQGVAVTYRIIRNNNSGYYSWDNLYWDQYSFNPYFSFFTSGWRQCFYDDTRSLGAKYDLVNRRGAGGIGIWALGYDNGHSELWELIADKFTQGNTDACADSLSDTGGPYRNYDNSQNYTGIVRSKGGGPLALSFSQLNLEPGYDSLWIYDGTDVSAPLLYALSGNVLPPSSLTTSETFMLRFSSDSQTTRPGYNLHYACPSVGFSEQSPFRDKVMLFPQPALNEVFMKLNTDEIIQGDILIYDLSGRLMMSLSANSELIRIPLHDLVPGLYMLRLQVADQPVSKKLLVVGDW
ncbi:MAG: glycosyl hydrolase family 18 protein [Lentimicrobium sp.]|jgi:spore germination protein YaaH|nr:glycosyl hydrolase family 18 protein [Lentimicrobium sp.]